MRVRHTILTFAFVGAASLGGCRTTYVAPPPEYSVKADQLQEHQAIEQRELAEHQALERERLARRGY
jgi:hypothetical protein